MQIPKQTDTRKNLFIQFFSFFDTKEKFEFVGMLIFTLSIAIFEMVAVGVIFPFIGIISNPAVIYENRVLHYIYETLRVNSEHQFLIWCSLGLLGLIVIKNCYYTLFLYVQQSYLTDKRIQYVTLIYQYYLRKPYTFHVKNNSAILLRNLTQADGIVIGILQPFFQVLAEALTIVAITFLLLYTNPLLTLVAVTLVALTSWAIMRVFGVRIKKLGEEHFDLCGTSSKVMLGSFGGIKEIKVMNRAKLFAANFAQLFRKLGKVRRNMAVINQMPRLFLEVVVFSNMIFVILFFLLQNQNLSNVLPTIGLFCVAAFRFMGSSNKLISGFNQIRFHSVLQDTVFKDLLQAKINDIDYTFGGTSVISGDIFRDCIELDRVSYRYSETDRDAVCSVSAVISKGASVGFVGPSGAGKSTLVDIILGLLPPDNGTLLVDGKNIQEFMPEWLRSIGYIPQDIFLLDDTLKRNIAFGMPDDLIDESAVLRAVQSSKLDSVVRQLPKGLDSIVGERGVRLSGGEKQRVAIARALYYDPSVIVMDEATSSLDRETESEVTEAIERLKGGKTIIIIAHRLTTVKKCDCVYFMMNGQIIDSGRLEDLWEGNPQFRKMAGVKIAGSHM